MGVHSKTMSLLHGLNSVVVRQWNLIHSWESLHRTWRIIPDLKVLRVTSIYKP